MNKSLLSLTPPRHRPEAPRQGRHFFALLDCFYGGAVRFLTLRERAGRRRSACLAAHHRLDVRMISSTPPRHAPYRLRFIVLLQCLHPCHRHCAHDVYTKQLIIFTAQTCLLSPKRLTDAQ